MTVNEAGYINRLLQKRRNSSALAMELRLLCTNPSISSREWQKACQWSLVDGVYVILVAITGTTILMRRYLQVKSVQSHLQMSWSDLTEIKGTRIVAIWMAAMWNDLLYGLPKLTQRAHDAIITLFHQNNIVTSFWHYNDVICAPPVWWVVLQLLFYSYLTQAKACCLDQRINIK